MRFQHIVNALHFEPWLITEGAHASLVAVVESRLAEGPFVGPVKAGTDLWGDELPQMRVSEGVAEIPIRGPIGKGLGNLERSCGATSIEDVLANVREAVGRQDVRGILLNIDSPGGTAQGVPEAAAEIARAAEVKPLLAFTDGMMASAAYWLGSQADSVMAAPSSNVGSIGVYFPITDSSRRAEAMGLKVGIVKNTGGTFKGMGFPGVPYSEEQLAHLQARADELFGMFRSAVLAKRPNVKPAAMRGQTLYGASARDAGLVDDVGGYDDAHRALRAMIQLRRGA